MLRNRDLKKELVKAHMQTAYNYANLSKAVRRKVGCIIVKDDRIISIGYNGTPKGWDNDCEHKEYMPMILDGWLSPEQIQEQWPFEEYDPDSKDNKPYRYKLATKPEVLHAELNALAKVAKSTESCEGASMFITCAPCYDCAKLVAESGIKEVFYSEIYRDKRGLDHLEKCGIRASLVE